MVGDEQVGAEGDRLVGDLLDGVDGEQDAGDLGVGVAADGADGVPLLGPLGRPEGVERGDDFRQTGHEGKATWLLFAPKPAPLSRKWRGAVVVPQCVVAVVSDERAPAAEPASGAPAGYFFTRSVRRSSRTLFAAVTPRPRYQVSSGTSLAWPALTAVRFFQSGLPWAASFLVALASP